MNSTALDFCWNKSGNLNSWTSIISRVAITPFLDSISCITHDAGYEIEQDGGRADYCRFASNAQPIFLLFAYFFYKRDRLFNILHRGERERVCYKCIINENFQRDTSAVYSDPAGRSAPTSAVPSFSKKYCNDVGGSPREEKIQNGCPNITLPYNLLRRQCMQAVATKSNKKVFIEGIGPIQYTHYLKQRGINLGDGSGAVL